MAIVSNVLKIEADANKPVEEINNIIIGFLRLHPGKERPILEAIAVSVAEGLARIPVPHQDIPTNEPDAKVAVIEQGLSEPGENDRHSTLAE